VSAPTGESTERRTLSTVRSVYRRVVPAALRDRLWRARQAVRERASHLRSSYLALRYGNRRCTVKRPPSHTEKTYLIETSAANNIRGAWLRKNVEGTVLDVGCGHGYATCDIARVVQHVHAVDVSEDLLRKAQDLAQLNHIDNVTFSVADAYTLPFESKSFDTVSLLEVLEHLERPDDAVREALRVARHRVVVTVPAKGHMRDVPGHIQDFGVDDIRALFPGPVRVRSRGPFTYAVCRLGQGSSR
jgi:2-polyprenyl-3-methyl-5-hydroxy-6-metoxy-1,4-benzoquinol methylase